MSGVGYSSRYKGIIKVSELKHPEKYADTEDIVFRSALERDFMFQFDRNPIYIKWCSESRELANQIVYENPLKKDAKYKMSRYYPDFLLKIKNNDQIVNVVAEVKPSGEVEAVSNYQKLKPNTKQFWRALQNIKKWEAAMKFCSAQTKNGTERWEFIIFTEKDLARMRN